MKEGREGKGKRERERERERNQWSDQCTCVLCSKRAVCMLIVNMYDYGHGTCTAGNPYMYTELLSIFQPILHRPDTPTYMQYTYTHTHNQRYT